MFYRRKPVILHDRLLTKGCFKGFGTNSIFSTANLGDNLCSTGNFGDNLCSTGNLGDNLCSTGNLGSCFMRSCNLTFCSKLFCAVLLVWSLLVLNKGLKLGLSKESVDLKSCLSCLTNDHKTFIFVYYFIRNLYVVCILIR